MSVEAEDLPVVANPLSADSQTATLELSLRSPTTRSITPDTPKDTAKEEEEEPLTHTMMPLLAQEARQVLRRGVIILFMQSTNLMK